MSSSALAGDESGRVNLGFTQTDLSESSADGASTGDVHSSDHGVVTIAVDEDEDVSFANDDGGSPPAVSSIIAADSMSPVTPDRPHQRKPLNQKEFLESHNYREKPRTGVVDKAKAAAHAAMKNNKNKSTAACCSPTALGRLVVRLMPILSWLPGYSLRKNIVGDTISGVTVAVMHIPQG
jgi:hypothetical protein